MARNILVGERLKEAQEQHEQFSSEQIENADLGVISYGTPVDRPSNMSARRETSFRNFLKESAERKLEPDRENIIEKREDGIYEGKSYVDNVTQKGVIEFVGPEGQIELSSGYNQEVSLEELADITAFKYRNPSDEKRIIFMDVNGQKVPVIEGEVTKDVLMDQYAQTQGYENYKSMKDKQAFETYKGNDNTYVPDARDWD